MKKTLAVILALVIVLALSACANKPVLTETPNNTSTTVAPNTTAAPSATWPNSKNIEMYTPFSAGGGTDMQARLYTEGMAKICGSNFVVINQTEGGGAVCYNNIKNVKPDGSTLCLTTSSWLTGYLGGTHNFNPVEDFTVIATINIDTPMYLLVPPTSEFNSLEDLVTWCKAHPGELNFGMQIGSMSHYQTKNVLDNLCIEVNFVETGSGDANRITAIMGGIIDATFVNAAGTDQYYEAGEVKILCSSGPLREGSALAKGVMKDIPALSDLGYKNCEVPGLVFMMSPKIAYYCVWLSDISLHRGILVTCQTIGDSNS